jgi:hypothetical protein
VPPIGLLGNPTYPVGKPAKLAGLPMFLVGLPTDKVGLPTDKVGLLVLRITNPYKQYAWLNFFKNGVGAAILNHLYIIIISNHDSKK